MTHRSFPIKNLNPHIQLFGLHSFDVWSMIELSDKRIATGSLDCSLHICSINLTTKNWTCDIKIENAHHQWIDSLCELSNSRLVSCSGDGEIKVWFFSVNELTLLHTLYAHDNWVSKAIVLTNDRFASSSWDRTIKIWNTQGSSYQLLKTLHEKGGVYSILKLKNKDLLISTNGDEYHSMSFWNLNTYSKETVIQGVSSGNSNVLLELPNGDIAVVSNKSSIMIVDPVNYVISKEIKDEEYIIDSSSLCLLNDNSFIYLCKGYFCQISIYDYAIIYKRKIENDCHGRSGLITKENGKYIITDNFQKGYTILKALL